MADTLKEWIVSTMDSLGYWGIGLLMFLENLFPPIPSELIMPLAGFTAFQGKMQLLPAIAAGVLGTILGAYPWYYLGKLVSEERLARWVDRYFRWLGISGQDIKKSQHWFQKYGNAAVFLCRMVPGVRTLISLPAGIEEMPILPFTLYSTGGTIIWVTLLTLAGYHLGKNYNLVEQYLDPFSKIILGSLVAIFIFWVVKRNLRRRSN